MNMQYSDKSRVSPVLRVALTALGTLVVLSIIISRFFSPLPYYPIIVGGGIPLVMALGMLLVLWYRKPVWAVYSALFVAFMPLGLIPGNMHSIINRTLVVVALALWLLSVFRRSAKVTWGLPSWLMLGFLFWGGVSLLWARNQEAGITSLEVYSSRVILFLVLIPNLIRTQKELNGLMSTLALSGWLLVVAGVCTIMILGYQPGSRLRVLEMNENELGIYLIVSMAGVLWPVMQPLKHNFLKKGTVGLFLLLAIGLIAMSGSRGSAISLFVLLLACCFWKPTRPWGKLGFLILGIGVLILPSAYETSLERFTGQTGGTPLGGREILWKAGWEIIKGSPLHGVGIGNSPYAMNSYLGEVEQDGVPLHNPILAIWSETGIPGIALYLGVLVSAVWSFLQKYKMIKRYGVAAFAPYFPLIGSFFLGYLFSWIKAGGVEYEITYFLMVALLMIPSSLNMSAAASKAMETRSGKRQAGVEGWRKI
jgi:putative inorganic carbon (HCO3(-)) transporter